MGKNPPELAMYKEQPDTPYVSNARKLSDRGFAGLEEYVPRVNTMDNRTQADLDANINSIYNRSLSDFNRDYKDTMAKTMAKAYGQFGTTGNTSSLYRNDMQNLQAQRALADLQYDKALTRDQMLNSELQRRYNTVNMYKGLYDFGQIPQKYDDQNYRLREITNVDRQYNNDFVDWQTKQKLQESLQNMGVDTLAVALAPMTGGTSLMLSGLAKQGLNSVTLPNSGMNYSGNIYSGGASPFGGMSGDQTQALMDMMGYSKGTTASGSKYSDILAKILKPQGQTLDSTKLLPSNFGNYTTARDLFGGYFPDVVFGNSYTGLLNPTQGEVGNLVNYDFLKQLMGGI